jgi:hypothetical protein
MGPIAQYDPRTSMGTGSAVRVTRGASVTAPPVTGYSAWNNAHSSSSPRICFLFFLFSFFLFSFFAEMNACFLHLRHFNT